MNCFHLILLSQVLFVKVRAGLHDSPQESSMYKPLRPPHHLCTDPPPNHQTLQLDNVKMSIMNHCKIISRVNLKRTNRVLANKYLPVWISTEKVTSNSLYNQDGNGIERNYKVMAQLGEFTTYHDTETSSAAVYFHKRREFDGMIGYKFLIQELSINSIVTGDETILKLNRNGVYDRSEYTGHEYDCRELEDDPMAGMNHQGDMKTYQGRVYDGFPEVLVIVSSGVVQDCVRRLPRFVWYKTIVSHVLTLFNGIDMLYSKLQSPKIQINIAGIIIEEEDSFLFLDHCYFTESAADEVMEYKLDGECVNSLLRTYLYGRKKKFPTDSYDIAVYLTNENIFLRPKGDDGDHAENMSEHIVGISGLMTQLYKSRSDDLESILLGTVTYEKYLDNYPTIAHEMAHLMTVMHDKLPFFTHDDKCIAKLLKTSGGWCDECLSWSETSKESFKLFFSSPNCCIFINEPRSLRPPGRHLMLTADEQCQCYGYESASKFEELPNGFCHSKLSCNGANDDIEYTVIPMDGTPCREQQVCSERRCENIEIFKISPWLQ